jgi:hypothetical protein
MTSVREESYLEDCHTRVSRSLTDDIANLGNIVSSSGIVPMELAIQANQDLHTLIHRAHKYVLYMPGEECRVGPICPVSGRSKRRVQGIGTTGPYVIEGNEIGVTTPSGKRTCEKK